VTLKTFSTTATHTVITYAKLHKQQTSYLALFPSYCRLLVKFSLSIGVSHFTMHLFREKS